MAILRIQKLLYPEGSRPQAGTHSVAPDKLSLEPVRATNPCSLKDEGDNIIGYTLLMTPGNDVMLF